MQSVSISSSFQALAAGLPSIARSRRRIEYAAAPRPERCTSSETKARPLLEWSALSSWRQQGSECLQTGYRTEPHTFGGCVHSWTYLHNETVNIYSHIFGALLFWSLPFYVFGAEIPPRYRVATSIDILVCSTYFLSVAICFTFSTIFHTFMHHSQSTYDLGIKFDYAGILLLMWGSTFPLIHYSFPHQITLQAAYVIVTTGLAGASLLATFNPSIGGPKLGHIRAVLFGSFGFGSFLVPIIHGVWMSGIAEQSRKVGLSWIGLTVFLNAVGVLAYALKFPEIRYPRQFDYFGASHQVMHVMVVCAALTYTRAVLIAFDYHHEH